MGERHSLRTIREERGLSREELGDLVGRSGEQIRRYELGDQDLTLRVALRIAQVLDVSIEEIAAEEPEPNGSSRVHPKPIAPIGVFADASGRCEAHDAGMRTPLLILVAALGLAGCGGSSASAPSKPATQVAADLTTCLAKTGTIDQPKPGFVSVAFPSTTLQPNNVRVWMYGSADGAQSALKTAKMMGIVDPKVMGTSGPVFYQWDELPPNAAAQACIDQAG